MNAARDSTKRTNARSQVRAAHRTTDRAIWALAIPAFLALIAEPLFLLADAAVIGHLGTDSLAGLGIAGVVLQTVVGLCVFLAYGTTASVARQLGAGDRAGALRQGVDGLWLGVFIGVIVTIPVLLAAEPLCIALGANEAVAAEGAAYLRVAILGVTPLLLLLAANGVLRGFQDTRTPLWVAIAGNAINIVLNVLFVYGFGFGIAGSAWGSVIAQLASAAILVAVIMRSARREQLSLAPNFPGVRRAARAAVPLVIRTLTLRAALLVTTFAVTTVAMANSESLQATNIAAHQLAMTLWTFLAFTLDAIAIAAQALTGRALGEGDIAKTRQLTRRMIWWGAWTGVGTGVALAAVSPFIGHLFSSDPAVHDALIPALLVAAAVQPIAGVVFVLDGVLIGAGDGQYLAWGGVLVLAVYAPIALWWNPDLTAVWIVFGVVFMGARLVVLTLRARSNSWMVTGASPNVTP